MASDESNKGPGGWPPVTPELAAAIATLERTHAELKALIDQFLAQLEKEKAGRSSE